MRSASVLRLRNAPKRGPQEGTAPETVVHFTPCRWGPTGAGAAARACHRKGNPPLPLPHQTPPFQGHTSGPRVAVLASDAHPATRRGPWASDRASVRPWFLPRSSERLATSRPRAVTEAPWPRSSQVLWALTAPGPTLGRVLESPGLAGTLPTMCSVWSSSARASPAGCASR